MNTEILNESLTWEVPRIQRIDVGGISKFGARMAGDVGYQDNIEGITIRELVQQFGSPLFVTSETRLRENVRQLKQAFSLRYPRVVHGWSYKTNYNSAICNIFHQEGSWAEVVSAFEYEKARALGVPADRILFNGPCKKQAILELAIHEGARLHVDNQDELLLIERIAQRRNQVVKLTIRLNFDTGYSEPWSRFGFNLENGQALAAAHYIHHSDYLSLTGLHSHIGTFILDTRAYQSQVRILCRFMRQVEAETDAIIESIDVGGGFASRNALQGVYLPPEQLVPSLDDYAETICSTLLAETRDRQRDGLPMPLLILESGRAMVDDAQVLLTSVAACKDLADGRRSLVLDAGVNILFTGFWYNHQVSLTHQVEDPGSITDTVLYGPLCMNIDVVRHSVSLPRMAVDDVLMIGPVGAYNNTQWMQFIEYRPNVVMIRSRENRQSFGPTESVVEVIREAEDLQVMNLCDNIPAGCENPYVEQATILVESFEPQVPVK